MSASKPSRSAAWVVAGMLGLGALLLLTLGEATAAPPAQTAPPTRTVVWDRPPLPVPRQARLGMNFTPPTPLWLGRARELGVGSQRWQLNWQDIEPTPDGWTWDETDATLRPMLDAGLEVELILTLPPAWAVEPGGSVPRDLYLAWDDPANRWGRFAYQATSHLAALGVRTFEVWNEPDNPDYWQGTAADYYQLLRVAYQAIKAADPGARVSMGGMAYWYAPTFWESVLQAAAQDPEAAAHDHFFDLVAFHWYSRSELLYERVAWARATLDRYGLAKPVWVNEVNAPLYGVDYGPPGPQPGYASQAEQAAFILQAHANALAAGAERVFLFRMNDEQMGLPFGLLRNDARRREAFVAYHVMAAYLGDADPVERRVEGGVVYARFQRGEETVTVLWNQTGEPVEAVVTATAPTARLVEQDGTGHSLRAADGVYRVALPAATNRGPGQDEYAIGGRTFILLQGSRHPPQSRLDPLPALAPDNPFAVSWTAEDPSGAGVVGYDVQTRREGGEWEDWLVATTQTSALFSGQDGGRYAFRVRARDGLGLVESWRDAPDAETALLGALDGSVRDCFNQLIVGARVCLDATCRWTDEAGVFRFSPWPPGRYRLTVSLAESAADTTAPWRLPRLQRWVQVALGEPRSYVVRFSPAYGPSDVCLD